MPDFYIKGVKLKAGFTYAVSGGNTGYTTSLFPNGASYLDAFNGFMVYGATATTVGVVFSGSTGYISNVRLNPGEVYPFRLRVLSIPTGGGDMLGLA
jgi:hypothetical protein